MEHEELLELAKPIFFNTEMVQAILAGRKTVTRRAIKPQPIHEGRLWELGETFWSDTLTRIVPIPCHRLYNRMPYERGSFLYVRETWQKNPYGIGWPYFYKASPEQFDHASDIWKPSIHMPKEATRICI